MADATRHQQTLSNLTKQMEELRTHADELSRSIAALRDEFSDKFTSLESLLHTIVTQTATNTSPRHPPTDQSPDPPDDETSNLGEIVKKERETMKQVILFLVVTGEGQADYYMVDLRADKARKTPIATLLNEDSMGSTLCSGSVLYNVGGRMPTNQLLFAARTNDNNHHIHKGASRLQLFDLPSLLDGVSTYEWESAPSITNLRIYPIAASLGGKVYVLGGLNPNEVIGEVFDPLLGRWKPLDSDFSWRTSLVSYPVIPDEKNHRLLVHFREVYSLYAYYPLTGKWECLDKRMLRWKDATALVGDVLYVNKRGKVLTSDCIFAYDLSTRAWLNVEYSVEFPLAVSSCKFSDMLYLGDGMLCLANCGPLDDENGKPFDTNIQFIKFRVERASPSVVRVTPVGAQCFPFEGYMPPVRFILP